MRLSQSVLAVTFWSSFVLALPAENNQDSYQTSNLVSRDGWNPTRNIVHLSMGEAKQHMGNLTDEDVYQFVIDSLRKLCTTEKCDDADYISHGGGDDCCSGSKTKDGIWYRNWDNDHQANNAHITLHIESGYLWKQRELRELMLMTVAETYKREITYHGSNCYDERFQDGSTLKFCNVGQKVHLSANGLSLKTQLTFNGNTDYGNATCKDWKDEVQKGTDLYKPDYIKISGLADYLKLESDCCDEKGQNCR
ncbi:hypothetical protein BDV96DRAFT_599173 [Lophiotrema nucula]|uniref:Uncharacterized protein n=1 Tax=Lophiotrema nucula TaxID=690887 RepID=A0A6A5ZCH2_9PLEO|nr:hypothetical protein BDV96DRAFT_599173 [Lophiotrema nucula]